MVLLLVACLCLTSSGSTQGQRWSTSRILQIGAVCNRLSEIDRIPFKDERVDSEIYNGIMAEGRNSVPCLVHKLTDLTRMKDPRTAPTYSDFRVGDLAFILLARITGTPFEQMLPHQVQARMSDEGVYAYFRYVQRPANRKTLQQKWRVWLKENGVK